jgi:phosphoribosylamine--glycine ligase
VKILVLGSGAREHAIITALLAENAGHDIIAGPGNAGIEAVVSVIKMDIEDPSVVVDFAVDNEHRARGGRTRRHPSSPESPRSSAARAASPSSGPDKAAAQLEGSKTFAKRIMEAAGVPTGGRPARDPSRRRSPRWMSTAPPHVIKADGLAAGKGVLVTSDRAAAEAHAEFYLRQGSVLVEEFLDGQEVSLFLLSDGHNVLPLSPRPGL